MYIYIYVCVYIYMYTKMYISINISKKIYHDSWSIQIYNDLEWSSSLMSFSVMFATNRPLESRWTVLSSSSDGKWSPFFFRRLINLPLLWLLMVMIYHSITINIIHNDNRKIVLWMMFKCLVWLPLITYFVWDHDRKAKFKLISTKKNNML